MFSRKRTTDGRRLPAATLPEVLVVMIVSAIVFLSVMDGLRLFGRYARDVGERLTGNIDFYEGYYRLYDMIALADSLTGDGERISCWQNGARSASLVHRDSLLTANYGLADDTLLHRIGRIRTYHRDDPSSAMDSLTVVIATGDGEVDISFAVDMPAWIKAQQKITEKEKEHEYE